MVDLVLAFCALDGVDGRLAAMKDVSADGAGHCVAVMRLDAICKSMASRLIRNAG